MNILMRTMTIVLLTAFPVCAAGEATSVRPQSTAATAIAKPVYQPPLRGAPAGRIGGGTRGATERESFTLQVLAPDHVGNTIQEQPCLYWYISKPTAYPLELTVTERAAVKPLVEKTLAASATGGIQSVCLADQGVQLRRDIQYKWFITLVTDPERRSKDILAGGMLMVVEPPPALAEKLKTAAPANWPNIYAAEGFWYDAMAEISKQIDAAPTNRELRNWRASLLEQVGLAEVAASEVNR